MVERRKRLGCVGIDDLAKPQKSMRVGAARGLHERKVGVCADVADVVKHLVEPTVRSNVAAFGRKVGVQFVAPHNDLVAFRDEPGRERASGVGPRADVVVPKGDAHEHMTVPVSGMCR